jgi:hypothetical protein
MPEPIHRVRSLAHFDLPPLPPGDRYAPRKMNRSGMAGPPPADRRAHGVSLQRELDQAVAEAQARCDATGLGVVSGQRGTYVVVRGREGVKLAFQNLASAGLEPLAHPVEMREGQEDEITVFIPEGKLAGVFKRLAKYAEEEKNAALVDQIGQLRSATLRSLWTDADRLFPEPGQTVWLEVWLRNTPPGALDRFEALARQSDVRVATRSLLFGDRVVVLARATPEQLEHLMERSGDLAELRRAKPHPHAFTGMRNMDQAEWVAELAARIRPAAANAPAVCLLDTGVNRGHPLIAGSLAPDDTHSVNPDWGTADDSRGHGTQMAGLALFGTELPRLLEGGAPVDLPHRLESVKILPPTGGNDPDLYGAVTRDAITVAENHALDRSARTFSMAITGEAEQPAGEPTSWSAAVDALAAGRVIDPRAAALNYDGSAVRAPPRLILVSSGNVVSNSVDHLAQSRQSPIEDPGQAWNAVTVGAFTELVDLDVADPALRGARPLARAGELSPFSTSSVGFVPGWPIKPEILMEGGNKYRIEGSDEAWEHPDLELLTTRADFRTGHFTTTSMTSAAVSQAARMAASIQADHPDYWPETVRALLVHSARWTPEMEAHRPRKPNRGQSLEFTRLFGYGVPDLGRALKSARDAVTLVCQDQLRPYEKRSYGFMNCHELPWPTEVLEGLGGVPVVLRATLSYFVAPYPVRKERERQDRYASTHLRFAFKQSLETPEEFLQRLNDKVPAEKRPTAPADRGDWLLGTEARHLGSLHHDIWRGSASELAHKGVMAVHPVAGWMKDAPRQRQGHEVVRYSLVVSIETVATDVDLWTPVHLQVEQLLRQEVDVAIR